MNALSFLVTLGVGILCLAASLVQFVAVRSPDTGDMLVLQRARRVTAMAFAIGGGYVIYCLFAQGWAHVPMCLVLGIAALGQILFGMHTFLEPSCTARLMARPQRKQPDEASHA